MQIIYVVISILDGGYECGSYEKVICSYFDLELALLHAHEANEIVKLAKENGESYNSYSPYVKELQKYDPEIDYVGEPDYDVRELELR